MSLSIPRAQTTGISSDVSAFDMQFRSTDALDALVATLAGLVRYSARKPGRPPLYIHVGYGVIVDEARGQAVDSVKEWVRYWPGLEECAS